jgi:hypothetical protein
MGKVDLARLQAGNRHTVKVVIDLEDAAGVKTKESITVVYRGITIDQGYAIQDRFNEASDEERRELTAKNLAEWVIDLPDVVDNGNVVKPTVEFFRALDTRFLHQIAEAIQNDRLGN